MKQASLKRSAPIVYLLGVVFLLAASIGAIADQSERFVGVYEVPPFVCSRVEMLQHTHFTVDGESDPGTPDAPCPPPAGSA